MAKATSVSRAPRGTKILAKAFFTAADEIPEPQRAEVIKAALVVIRDELKANRERAAAAKAKAREKTKAPASSGRKAASVDRTPAKAMKKAGSVKAKSPAKRIRKSASPPAEPAMPDMSVEPDLSSEA